MSAEPNYEMLFRSAVSGLKEAYNKYKHVVKNYYDSTAIDDDGNFVINEANKAYRDEANSLVDEMDRLRKDVANYREKCWAGIDGDF